MYPKGTSLESERNGARASCFEAKATGRIKDRDGIIAAKEIP